MAGLCASVLSIASEKAMMTAVSGWSSTPGLHSVYWCAKASMMRSIFCASPGSLMKEIIRRSAESSGSLRKERDSMIMRSACWFSGSWPPRKSPTFDASSLPSFARRNCATSTALPLPSSPCESKAATAFSPDLALLKRRSVDADARPPAEPAYDGAPAAMGTALVRAGTRLHAAPRQDARLHAACYGTSCSALDWLAWRSLTSNCCYSAADLAPRYGHEVGYPCNRARVCPSLAPHSGISVSDLPKSKLWMMVSCRPIIPPYLTPS
mmetsp:Transcript_49252/g.106681  ORF Transcript_49252/g.106681 Transcript_49252/m.106681 type:complete len:267 (-) Transcript_49252:443-1243(-)